MKRGGGILAILTVLYYGVSALIEINWSRDDRYISLYYYDGESVFASGRKIPLAEASLYELILISGVSDTMAQKILDQKDQLIKSANRLPIERSYTALESIKGIGPKKAEAFGHYITLKNK